MESTHYKPYPNIGHSILILLILALTGILAFPLSLAKGWIGEAPAMLLTYAATFGIAFWILHTIRRRVSGRTDYRFGLVHWKVPLLLALGSVALLLGVATPLMELIPLTEYTRNMIAEAAGHSGPATFVMFVLLAPLFEELIFRGVMLDGLLRTNKPVTAIAVSSLLFGIAHFNELQLVTGLVLGTFLGWVYYRTRSVGACIVVHLAANLSGYIMRLFVDPETEMDLDQSLFEMWGVLPAAIAIVGSCVVFAVAVFLLKREFDRVVPLPDESAEKSP